jgi:ribosome-associated protein
MVKEMTEQDADDFAVEEEISKSELKREMLALQQLGERLVKLAPGRWTEFAFSPVMLAALEESRRIKSHNAMRRHVRRLGKLLRDEDTELVKALFQRMDNAHLQDTQRFHRLEQWRDRLLQQGDSALQALLEACPDADRQHLRQLIRTARREEERERPPTARRKLFKYLKTLDLD